MSKTSTKYFDASDEFLRSNNFKLGTESDLFREMPSVCGEKPVRSGAEGRHKYGDIGDAGSNGDADRFLAWWEAE